MTLRPGDIYGSISHPSDGLPERNLLEQRAKNTAAVAELGYVAKSCARATAQQALSRVKKMPERDEWASFEALARRGLKGTSLQTGDRSVTPQDTPLQHLADTYAKTGVAEGENSAMIQARIFATAVNKAIANELGKGR